MKLLLKKVNIISPGSPHHLKIKDVMVDGNKIIAIEDTGNISSSDCETIEEEDLFVSPGWFDLHANFCDPGEEVKEDIESGSRAAAQGGFTGVLVMPSTSPAISSRPSVEYIVSKAANLPVHIHVAGTISHNAEGKDLSEMFDMMNAGVKVFTDDKKVINDSALMARALLYACNIGGKIFSFAQDKNLSERGLVNEGINSTMLGLRGIPDVAEEIIINRDVALCEHTNTAVHFSTVTSRKGVDAIRKAKNRGLKISADVSSAHLFFDDSVLEGFDTIYKLKPPIRSRDDRAALIEGLNDGTIDCICSDHSPQNFESKQVEFELAAYGASGIETAFAVARTATLKTLSLPELISKFSIHPRMCAGLKSSTIETGHVVDLTLFLPNKKWKVKEDHILSRSKNNPFIGKELTGKPYAIINKGQIIYCKA